GAAARHVDAPMRAGGARGGVARLADGFVRDAARVHDGDVCGVVELGVAVGEEALTGLPPIHVRDLAPQEANREGRHGAGPYSLRRKTSAAQPLSVSRCWCRKSSPPGASSSR